MAARKADAEWTGNLREGAGTVKLGSGTFEGKYSFATRFEEAPGTNPEELIAAAHAGCFSMALVAGLDDAAFQEQAKAAKENCPVSKALRGVETITLNARLFPA